ncbi:unnamed protein product [Scytosiphon promiscuus]
MTSTGMASSARRLAILRRGSRRFVAPQTLGIPSACPACPAAAVSRTLPPPSASTAVFSRNSSSRSKASSSAEVAAAGSSNAPVAADQDHLALAKPLDFDMASKVEGQESQMVTFELEPDQVIRAEAGNLIFMEDGIEMDTNTGGGASSMFRRVITGQNMFVTDYVNRGDKTSKVGLGTDLPSKIVRLPLSAYGGEIICQRGAFLAGSHTIDIQTEFTKMMAGFFGGEGFVLQRLTGEGDAFVKASGPLIQRELKDGETLRVSSGSVVAFSTSVQYDVQTVPGFKNVVFGGEGLFITKLTGPGTVFLQGLPFDRMVDQIARRIPGGRGGGMMPIPMGMGGGADGEDDGGEGGEGGAEGAAGGDAATAAAAGGGGGAGGEAAAAAAAEDSSTMGSSTDGGGGGGGSSDLFGDAAPSSSASTDSGDGGASAGFDEPDAGFSQPPPDSGPEEPTWTESGFEEEDGGGGDDWGEGMGDDGEGAGGGVVGTLKRIYSMFGGDD